MTHYSYCRCVLCVWSNHLVLCYACACFLSASFVLCSFWFLVRLNSWCAVFLSPLSIAHVPSPLLNVSVHIMFVNGSARSFILCFTWKVPFQFVAVLGYMFSIVDLRSPESWSASFKELKSYGSFDLERRGSLEAHFGLFWALVTKWIASCDSFWAYLALGNQSAQNEPPETHSGHIWRQAAKMLKIRLLRLILAISRTRQPKCSKWHSWGSLWPYLAPGSQIYAFRLTVPCLLAYEAIHARRFMRLDWQLHGFRHMKL